MDTEQVSERICPVTGEPMPEDQHPESTVTYDRNLSPQRVVDWVVAIHGMKSRGEWQERLTWLLGTTWGRSVPVAVYKYGYIVPGVIIPWRRKQLRNRLRAKLAVLQSEAHAHGFKGYPDVIAHSFGTWLLGHMLQEELKRAPADRVRFGRIILIGCILRPDFPWKDLKAAGLVGDVLNHFGDKDAIVPLARYSIGDSGPSGRRGFDGDEVINVRASGYGHTDLFVTEQYVQDGRSHQPGGQVNESMMYVAYKEVWKPFLTWPRSDLKRLDTEPADRPRWR